MLNEFLKENLEQVKDQNKYETYKKIIKLKKVIKGNTFQFEIEELKINKEEKTLFLIYKLIDKRFIFKFENFCAQFPKIDDQPCFSWSKVCKQCFLCLKKPCQNASLQQASYVKQQSDNDSNLAKQQIKFNQALKGLTILYREKYDETNQKNKKISQVKPEEKPEEKPEQKPEQKSEEKSEEKPKQKPKQKPKKKLERKISEFKTKSDIQVNEEMKIDITDQNQERILVSDSEEQNEDKNLINPKNQNINDQHEFQQEDFQNRMGDATSGREQIEAKKPVKKKGT